MLVRIWCQTPPLLATKYCLMSDTPIKHWLRRYRSLRVVVREDTLRSNFYITLGRIFPFEVADCRCSFYDSSPFSFDFDFDESVLKKFFQKKVPPARHWVGIAYVATTPYNVCNTQRFLPQKLLTKYCPNSSSFY